jgi:phosphate transport system permease protein
MGWVFRAAGMMAVTVLLGIFAMLVYNGASAFRTIPWVEFFSGAEWRPSAYGRPSYGIGAMVVSTWLVTSGAMMLSIPLGIGAAAYLSEVASPGVRSLLKSGVELLAGVPSVVVGFLGIVWVGPWLARVTGQSNGLNALNGSILLAVMSLPTLISVAEDAIRSVPRHFKEAAYALGADRWTTLLRVTLPAALPGLVAAVILGTGRAVGETMTVLMATGNAAALPGGFFDSVRTMAATIAIELGEAPYGTPHYHGLFAVGGVLFLMTMSFNLLAERVAARFRYRV